MACLVKAGRTADLWQTAEDGDAGGGARGRRRAESGWLPRTLPRASFGVKSTAQAARLAAAESLQSQCSPDTQILSCWAGLSESVSFRVRLYPVVSAALRPSPHAPWPHRVEEGWERESGPGLRVCGYSPTHGTPPAQLLKGQRESESVSPKRGPPGVVASLRAC